MENFILYNPVKLHFGKNVLESLGYAASLLGKKALLVYGKGSVKTNGAYRQTIESLQAAGISCFDYEGIKPNPIIEDVDKAAALGREKKVDMVIGLGGGSAIDSAKVIAITIPADHSGWEFIEGTKKPKMALPVIAVLTLAATGTEMNPVAVVQHDALQKKSGYGHPLMYPKYSFLDPSFTTTVPANYTAYGIVDLIAHALEAWFGEGDASLSDRFVASIIREAMDYGPALMDDPTNYDLRARIMYAATCALNGMTLPGRKSGDWAVHGLGHCLSVKWDVPHGASLSIAYPAWLTIQEKRIPERIIALGKALFDVSTTGETIQHLTAFFASLKSPVTLRDAEIVMKDADTSSLFEIMRKNKVNGLAHKLTEADYKELIDLMA